MRMAGQMGNATATILNLEVLEIIADDNAVVVSGAVPGPDGAILAVHHAARPRKRSNVKVIVSA
jgi:large subunit ribosomal protein L3